MKQIKAGILQNKKVASGFYNMRIKAPYLAKNITPGQFVEVKCSEDPGVLLRRPLGCHKILKNGIEMLYEVVGKGTEVLSQKKNGEMLDIIGPLGNGFNMRPKTIPRLRSGQVDHRPILVAGGIGVAPLLALAESLVGSWESGVGRGKIYVLIGAKTKGQVLCKSDFERLGAEVIISTEDGSQGTCGLITDCLRLLLQTPNSPVPSEAEGQLSTIYACGPNAMLKVIALIARRKRIPCQVSLEEHMACGVGVCLGCPIKMRTGEYKMVCKDGPIFNSEEIAW